MLSRGAGSAPPEGVCGAATIPLRPAPPGIHDPGPNGHADRGIDHLESAPLFVLVVGAGRVGASVATKALRAGHTVSVLDEDPLSHERLDVELGKGWEEAGGRFTIGTALEMDALVEAGIE